MQVYSLYFITYLSVIVLLVHFLSGLYIVKKIQFIMSDYLEINYLFCFLFSLLFTNHVCGMYFCLY